MSKTRFIRNTLTSLALVAAFYFLYLVIGGDGNNLVFSAVLLLAMVTIGRMNDLEDMLRSMKKEVK